MMIGLWGLLRALRTFIELPLIFPHLISCSFIISQRDGKQIRLINGNEPVVKQPTIVNTIRHQNLPGLRVGDKLKVPDPTS